VYTMMSDKDVRASSGIGGDPSKFSCTRNGQGNCQKDRTPHIQYLHPPRSQWQALLSAYIERSWSLFAAKELMDNLYDWFNEVYPNSPKQDRKISLRVWPFEHGVRIAVRNSNVDNIPVFQNLGLTFDLAMWYSSKRNQHKGGALTYLLTYTHLLTYIPVFQNLGLTFDLAMWYSSKRNQHKGGALNDASKRTLKIGSASWTNGYNSQDSFIDRQWATKCR
jgi:hypothetical protein